ncbi:MAG: LON peptidase substrate-binding domain-containing protein [Thermoanaerobaculum sp.]|nr:LON peptidase substrate-binding domain-containing protein [Thermoanaerobaculum sp.]MDW7968676.1 hypothetical protein [Thermoanaerobaculum sp.]
MQSHFLLPLYPLDGLVLLPTLKVEVCPVGTVATKVFQRAVEHQHQLVASCYEDESVHEVGVLARVFLPDDEKPRAVLQAVSRCRLRKLVAEDVPMVLAEEFPDTPRPFQRTEPLRRLLLTRYARLCLHLNLPLPRELRNLPLWQLTWKLTSQLNLDFRQQQGLLNLPDPVTRGQILLLAVKDLERKERFLRPFAKLRKGGQWN